MKLAEFYYCDDITDRELTLMFQSFCNCEEDDLDSVELCMALEDEFDIMIPEEDWPQMGDEDKFTVKQIRELVQNRLAAKKG